MDKFEQTMKEMAKMPPVERERAIGAEKNKCICSTCPTFTGCAKNAGEIFYCANGNSFMCISADKGCICPTCPVMSDLGLKYKSYCLKGSEKALRYENTLWGTRRV
jgi:hypothetical protein